VLSPYGDGFNSEAIRVVKTIPAKIQIDNEKLGREIWIMPVAFKETLRKE
jgi:hypothetical protein